MWITNCKSMKLDFETLCIEEKTILQIKSLLPLFPFPAESLWLGVSFTGYWWVSRHGRRASVEWVLGGSWVWVCTGFTLTQSLQVAWIQLTSVICFHAVSFTALTNVQTSTCHFRAVFPRQGGSPLPQSNCFFPLCVSTSCSCAKWEELTQHHVLPSWKNKVGFDFVFLLALSLSSWHKERSSVSCLQSLHAYIVTLQKQ